MSFVLPLLAWWGGQHKIPCFAEGSYLSVSEDGVIKDMIHLAGRRARLHLSPQTDAAFFKELNAHFLLEGNNWRKECVSADSKLLYSLSTDIKGLFWRRHCCIKTSIIDI